MFLLLGAVVNVAVAWGCAALLRFEYPQKARSGLLETTAPAWLCSISRRTGYRRIALGLEHRPDNVDYLLRRQGFDSEVSAVVPSDWLSTLDKSEYAEQYPTRTSHNAYGWPVLSMWCWFREFRFPRASGPELFGGLQLSDFAATGPRDIRWYRLRALPLRPLWPGFGINTMFYATLLWLLIPGRFVLRRFLRLRRGLCPQCAYPMGESSVCTECGRALSSPIRVA